MLTAEATAGIFVRSPQNPRSNALHGPAGLRCGKYVRGRLDWAFWELAFSVEYAGGYWHVSTDKRTHGGAILLAHFGFAHAAKSNNF